MHAEPLNINIDEALEAEPMQPKAMLTKLMWLCVFVGVFMFTFAIFSDYPKDLLWGSYFVDVTFFMGLAAGSVMISVILQIVRAIWGVPVRRLAEANVAFLPYIFMLFLCTYFGRQYLFPWARAPMPGREWWMQPDFVYARFAFGFGVLFLMLNRYVRNSLRGDIGCLREHAKNKKRWAGPLYDALTRNWKGTDEEIKHLQPLMSVRGPLVVLVYVVVFSLFAFEMVMGMNTIWYANMFGGFNFIGNIFLSWAVLSMSVVYHSRTNPAYGKTVGRQQLHDLGTLTFGFCMLWGYLFFAQFLPQWYGNLPEETAWMILRTREFPWKGFGWFVFPMCFVIPFILLLSEDIKKNPATLATVSLIIFIGVWCEKYIIIMPEISPATIPLNVVDFGLFFGFLGAYVLCIQSFLSKYPYIPVSHPQTQGRTDW